MIAVFVYAPFVVFVVLWAALFVFSISATLLPLNLTFPVAAATSSVDLAAPSRSDGLSAHAISSTTTIFAHGWFNYDSMIPNVVQRLDPAQAPDLDMQGRKCPCSKCTPQLKLAAPKRKAACVVSRRGKMYRSKNRFKKQILEPCTNNAAWPHWMARNNWNPVIWYVDTFL